MIMIEELGDGLIVVSMSKIRELREMVWGMDVPHSTVPEYVELHKKMQKILKFIDQELLEETFDDFGFK